MDFAVSPRARDYLGRIRAFMAEHITPYEAELLHRQRTLANPWRSLDCGMVSIDSGWPPQPRAETPASPTTTPRAR